MKCLVTGAAGFIGKSIVDRLSKEGYSVKALLHKSEPKKIGKNVEYITGDITDYDSIDSLLNDVETVIHCAAYVKDYGKKEPFYKINVEGTKNLIKACEKYRVKKFIFLSHIRYESEKKTGYYSETKYIAEQYLLKKFSETSFPVVIIRPGNVYGPGATTWVLRPLKSIQKNRISLIDHGKGIFLHTYIDNLVDAIFLAISKKEAIGHIIDITDGDNNTTWGEYLDFLSEIVGKSKIKRNISKNTALLIGKFMMLLNKIFKMEPWVTPMAVKIFTNENKVSIDEAKLLLDYEPKIDLKKGLEEVKNWLKDEGYIE